MSCCPMQAKRSVYAVYMLSMPNKSLSICDAQSIILPVDGTAKLPTAGGTAGRLVEEERAGAGPNVLTEAPGAGAPLLGAALYIDLSSQVSTLLRW